MSPFAMLSRRAAAAVNTTIWANLPPALADRAIDAIGAAKGGWADLPVEYQALILRAEGKDAEADRALGIVRR